MSRVLLLGAGGPAGENFCRAVQLAGHAVAGVDPDPWARAALQRRLDRARGPRPVRASCDFVHAQPDQEVLRLALEPPAVRAMPAPRRPGDRHRPGQAGHDRARSATWRPNRWRSGSEGDVAEALARWGWPVWFRARRGAGSLAALPVEGVEIGMAWINFWKRRGVALMASPLPAGAQSVVDGGLRRATASSWPRAAKERLEMLGASRSPSGPPRRLASSRSSTGPTSTPSPSRPSAPSASARAAFSWWT